MPSPSRLLCLALPLICAWPGSVRAELGFPAYVALGPQIVTAPDQALVAEDVGTLELPVDAEGARTEEKRGRHFMRWLAYRTAPGEPAPGYYNGTEGRIAAVLLAGFAKAGWQTVYKAEGQDRLSLHLTRDGRDVWAAVTMDAPQAQIKLDIVEVGQVAAAITLPRPSAKPERSALKADLPYLPPWPGSRRTGEGRDDRPLDVSVPGAGGEPRLVGRGVETRSYQGPASLSRLQFVEDMRAALTAAGWEVLYPASAEAARDFGAVAAHYARDGRDIWARLTYEYGASLGYTVADLAAEDWSAAFDRSCKLPLYGVFFDFDKAVVKPESEPVLDKAATLLKSRKARVQIAGHTDAVGGDEYNIRLSGARAASVRDWLAQHGVDAGRLDSRGYGKSSPVADNGSDDGRARNRRVELVNLDCARK